MKPARLILVLVALVAGGLAAFFALNTGNRPEPAPQIAEEEPVQQVRVLIASRSIGVGEYLTPSAVSWQVWPEDAIQPEFITDDRLPDAPQQMEGTISRFEIFAGDPIREAKLVRSAQGYLSAVIGKGMRGVSIEVSAESGAGGFIVPNDRVDVVLTQISNLGDTSQTILENARVLAIGKKLGEIGENSGAGNGEQARPEAFEDKTIATLELTPRQAEALINASKFGELSLVLRSIVDFVDGPAIGGKTDQASVRLIRAGKQSNAVANLENNEADAAAEASTQPSADMPVFSTTSEYSNVPGAPSSGPDDSGPVLVKE
ncbi:Flp pilus assembly protein CpaB [Maritalea mediterranea]|uniref:Flp pilus assembly protein CpaB n=1 Tax=Maritalea mediterranea TaxID=2909667 RepID=A0ABS9E3T9_9HYPH|nr:Flp pilus assembly protein CpaB [Maritalea mediterranea]MCF4097472.1 Flp pilus assembly protein CpaB [Maritalea mediterranea]